MGLELDALSALMGLEAFEAIAVLDGTTIVACNSALEAMLGIPKPDILGRSAMEFASDEDRERVADSIRAQRESPYDAHARRADGSSFIAEIRARQVEIGGRTLRLTSLRDVTAQRRTEQEVQRREQKYRELFEGNADGLMVMGRDGTPKEVNQRLCAMLGRSRSEILQMRPDQAIAGLDRTPMRLDRLAREESYVVERQLHHADGSLVDVEVHLRAIESDLVLAVLRDIRARRRASRERAELRDELQHTRHLEAIARFAGGVAHDFNNLLFVITAAAEQLKLEHSDSPAIDEICVAAGRATELTTQLATFGRDGRSTPSTIEVNGSLEQLAPMLRRLIGPKHSLKLALCPDALYILGDPTHLTRLVMNLVANARDAMPDGGAIEVRLARSKLPDAGPAVAIDVCDSGAGIDPRTRRQLFEPYFTTKDQARHSGLGLAAAHGIVEAAKGLIEVESDPGHTCFRVLWPLAASPAQQASGASEAEERWSILVVEDTDAVRRAVLHMLGRLGHQTFEADGPAAARALVASGISYDLLVTDVVMPGESGVDLWRSLGEGPAVFVTGYTELNLGDLGERTRVLAKPFTLAELESAIGQLGPELARHRSA